MRAKPDEAPRPMPLVVAVKPPRHKFILYVVSGRAFLRLADGWVDLGPEELITKLEPDAQLAMIHERLKGPHWHQVPRRPM